MIARKFSEDLGNELLQGLVLAEIFDFDDHGVILKFCAPNGKRRRLVQIFVDRRGRLKKKILY